MTPWYDIYRERMNSKYREHVAVKYAPFLKTIYDARGSVITEIGCGAGNVTRLLREMHKNQKSYHLIDSCPKMLSLAIENNPAPNCIFTCADILKHTPWQSDVVHSHGLLEHFDDQDIRFIVKMMTFVSPLQIHYVPGAKYEKPSRGDERLMEPDRWEHILRRVHARVSVSTFNNDLDIIIRVEK